MAGVPSENKLGGAADVVVTEAGCAVLDCVPAPKKRFGVLPEAAVVVGVEMLCCGAPNKLGVVDAPAPELAFWLNNPPVVDA